MDKYTTEEADLLRRGIEAQNAKLARYEEALRFYATQDNGETARKALEDNQ